MEKHNAASTATRLPDDRGGQVEIHGQVHLGEASAAAGSRLRVAAGGLTRLIGPALVHRAGRALEITKIHLIQEKMLSRTMKLLAIKQNNNT